MDASPALGVVGSMNPRLSDAIPEHLNVVWPEFVQILQVSGHGHAEISECRAREQRLPA